MQILLGIIGICISPFSYPHFVYCHDQFIVKVKYALTDTVKKCGSEDNPVILLIASIMVYISMCSPFLRWSSVGLREVTELCDDTYQCVLPW